MKFWHPCPKCDEEIYVEVSRGECDLPECCPVCQHAFDDDEQAAVLEKADEIAREPMDDDVR